MVILTGRERLSGSKQYSHRAVESRIAVGWALRREQPPCSLSSSKQREIIPAIRLVTDGTYRLRDRYLDSLSRKAELRSLGRVKS